MFFIPVRPEDSEKNSSNCAVIVHNPIASLGPLSPSPRRQSRDWKPGVHDSTAPAFALLEPTLHIANIQKLLKNQRWLSFCRASNSKGGLLKHVMSELTLLLVCTRFAVPLTAHASPAHLWSGFLGAWSKIGHFERSSCRCAQPMFWSHAHVKK